MGARPGGRGWQNVVRAVVSRDRGVCGICGHPGALTADHKVPRKHWPRDAGGRHLPGVDDPDNLRAAHGTRGTAPPNPCPACGRLCNQSRGAPRPADRHSRDW